MKKLLLIIALAFVASACTKEAKVTPVKPKAIQEVPECKKCACNPAYCPVGTAD